MAIDIGFGDVLGKMNKGLIIRDPWIEMLLDGEKTWEIRRSKPTQIRGNIGLIKSGTKQVFGSTDLVDCIMISHEEFNSYFEFHRVTSS